jgi:hypothetical protein
MLLAVYVSRGEDKKKILLCMSKSSSNFLDLYEHSKEGDGNSLCLTLPLYRQPEPDIKSENVVFGGVPLQVCLAYR